MSEHLDSLKPRPWLFFRDPADVRANAAAKLCRYEVMTVSEIAQKASAGDLDIPAFQRGYVWTEAQFRDLAESLFRDYPIGMLLIWESKIGDTGRTALLLADGQHRVISLCALFGQKPRWCAGEGNGSHPEMSIWFDPGAKEPPFFYVSGGFQRAGAVLRRLVLLPRLLSLNLHTANGQEQLRALANEVAGPGPRSAGAAVNHIYGRLVQACAIADRQVIAAVVRHPRDDVMEIFTRLSGHGIRFRRLLLRTALKATRSLWDPRPR